MTRVLVPIVAFALGLGAALALVSCGEDEEGLLPGETADQILANLESVERLAAEGDCAGAEDAAAEVADQVEQLGPQVSERLRNELAEGAALLQETAVDCVGEETEPVEPIVTDTVEDEPLTDEDTDEEPENGDDDDEDTEEEPTTETQPTTETTPTEPTTPTTPTTPSEDGGAGSGGIGPGRVATGED